MHAVSCTRGPFACFELSRSDFANLGLEEVRETFPWKIECILGFSVLTLGVIDSKCIIELLPI